jgi:hypothetical protein
LSKNAGSGSVLNQSGSTTLILALDEETLDEPGEGEEAVSPKVVGHNIYILCHQLALYNKVNITLNLTVHSIIKTKPHHFDGNIGGTG